MVTLALFGLLAVLVAGVLFLLAAYLLPAGEQIAPPIRDEPLWDLPAERQLRSDDIAAVRLPVALRGYRFAETDLLLDRLGEELRARDEELARLRGHAPQYGPESAESAEVWGRGSDRGLSGEPDGSESDAEAESESESKAESASESESAEPPKRPDAG